MQQPVKPQQSLTKLFQNLQKEYAFKKMAIPQTTELLINFDDIVDLQISTELGTLIYRSINNFVQNAIEATPREGKITITVCKSKIKNNFIDITVTDTGRGIPAHIIAKLGHEKLSYGKNTEPENTFNSGSGIALYNAKNDLAKFDSALVITSIENQGTSICMIVKV